MSKTLRLVRDELVWQRRENTWDESDYKRFLDWLKSFKERSQTEPWYINNAKTYDFLSQFTWDEIVNYIDNVPYNEQPELELSYGGRSKFVSKLADIIQDAIREENYDTDVISEEYADDYEESWIAEGEGVDAADDE